MTIDLEIQKQVVLLHLDGMGGYEISKKTKINYRTAKKYCDNIDRALQEIYRGVVSAIIAEIKKNPDNFAANMARGGWDHGKKSGN